MDKLSFAKIFSSHHGKVSDKWSLYLPIYDRTFSRFRAQPVNVLEIGVQNGGSLEVYSKYFDNYKTLVGCDVNPDCEGLKYDGNIHVVVGDCNLNHVQAKIRSCASSFDIIIDDGSHTSPDIINTFFKYFQILKPGGVYLIEDLHASYWKDWEGGLFHPESSMAFLKALSDVLNVQHWGSGMTGVNYLQTLMPTYTLQINGDVLDQILSIQFYNSVCVIEKAPSRAFTLLGKRIVRGEQASVAPLALTINDTEVGVVDQSDNVYAQFRQNTR